MIEMIENLKGTLIVSCQALEDEPLFGSMYMSQMAVAAVEGGASAIRANGPDDIKAIKEKVSVPIIGLYKNDYKDSDIYITTTMKEVDLIIEAGADIVAFDATNRFRPNGVTTKEFIREIKNTYPDIPLMADISTLDEGITVADCGVDIVSTTLSGYTKETAHINAFDQELLASLKKHIHLPVVAEGRVNTPKQAALCLKQGAHAVVVGTAITRPQEITKKFYQAITDKK